MAAVQDEARLARAAASGDGSAFAALYDSYESRIFNFCLRLVGSREDAADATQDAFVKVLQRLPKITGELNFGAYLYTAARNASYDIIGKRKRAEPVEEIGDVSGKPLHGDERGDIHVDPERAALLADFQLSVQAANARLPDRQREVLALRELEDLSYDEIAEIMDMNRNSVAQLISRARIKLRDELQGSALASVAASGAECERALPLIAMRQDGQLTDDDDREWLAAHIKGCETCRVSVEAMEEAGVSYRAWAPIVPLLWLRKATIAKAAERCGFDWSHVPDRADAGSGSGSGPGGGGGGTAGAAAGAGAGLGASGEADADAPTQSSSRKRRRRTIVLGAGGGLLLMLLFVQLLGSGDTTRTAAPRRVAQTLVITTTPVIPTATTPPVHHKRDERKRVVHHRKHHHHHHHTTVSSGRIATEPTITPSTTVAAPISVPTPSHHVVKSDHHTGSHHTTSSSQSGLSGHTTKPTVTKQVAPPTTTTVVTPPPITTTAVVTPPPPPTTTGTTSVAQPPTPPPHNCPPTAAGLPGCP